MSNVHDATLKSQTTGFDRNVVRLVSNGINLTLFNISFSTFWLPLDHKWDKSKTFSESQNILKTTDVKKSPFAADLSHLKIKCMSPGGH